MRASRCKRCGRVKTGALPEPGKCPVFTADASQRDYHDDMPITLTVREDRAHDLWMAANAEWRERGW